eukprot:317319-Alexandrium_andersonii.AAC.1
MTTWVAVENWASSGHRPSWTPTMWSRACSASAWSCAMRPVGMVSPGARDDGLDVVSSDKTLAVASLTCRAAGPFRVLDACSW